MASTPQSPQRLWLCPHETISFEQAKKFVLYHPPDAKECYQERLKDTCPHCDNNLVTNHIRMTIPQGEITLLTTIGLWAAHGVEDAEACTRLRITPSRVEDILAGLDLPICAHLRTNDWRVTSCWRQCNMHLRIDGTESRCYCEARRCSPMRTEGPHYRPCIPCYREGTYTNFGFKSWHHVVKGKKCMNLRLYIFRDLGCLDSSTDPPWRLHSASPADLAYMPLIWREWLQASKAQAQRWEIDSEEAGIVPRSMIRSKIFTPFYHGRNHNQVAVALTWLPRVVEINGKGYTDVGWRPYCVPLVFWPDTRQEASTHVPVEKEVAGNILDRPIRICSKAVRVWQTPALRRSIPANEDGKRAVQQPANESILGRILRLSRPLHKRKAE
jgi:hypothetical protein